VEDGPHKPAFSGRNQIRQVGEESISLMQCVKCGRISGSVAKWDGTYVYTTFHVSIEEGRHDSVSLTGEAKEEILDFIHGREQNSRLACQIWLNSSPDGITVYFSEPQR
jgi:hypothetical protein